LAQQRLYASNAQRQAAYRERCRLQREREAARRGLPPLPAVPAMPGTARWQAALRQVQALLDCVAEEMQDYHDQRSERWQDAERAQDLRQRIHAVQTAADALQEALL
jgi:hypothetical protein